MSAPNRRPRASEAPLRDVGAHMSIAGGLHLALERGHALGCGAVQIFLKNQRQWAAKPLGTEEARAFHAARMYRTSMDGGRSIASMARYGKLNKAPMFVGIIRQLKLLKGNMMNKMIVAGCFLSLTLGVPVINPVALCGGATDIRRCLPDR